MNDLSSKLSIANDLREQEKFADSIKEYTECLIQQIENNDDVGTIHSLCGQSLVYKILSRKTTQSVYTELTIGFAKAALNVLENNQSQIDNHTQSIVLSTYADSLLMNKQFAEAQTYMQRAYNISPASIPEKGRLKAHMGGLKYLLGDKNGGLSLIEEALTDIRTGDMNDYSIRVWETGCLNSLAKIYALESNLEKANNIIEESIQISSDHQLSIRKREAEEIKNKITSGKLDFSL